MILTTRGYKIPEAQDSLRASVDYLKDTFDRIGLDEDSQDSYLGGSHFLVTAMLERIALAEKEHKKTIELRLQEGVVTFVNRGVISRCAVSKSGSDRTVNLASGTAFAAGRAYPVSGVTGAATLPDNGGTSAQNCTIYLSVGASGLTCGITTLGGSVPDGAISLYTATIPAGNNATVDPTAAAVTLASVMRVEADWPILVSSPVLGTVVIQDIPPADYRVHLDPVSWVGPQPGGRDFLVQDRLSNGFKIYYSGIADSVVCRYLVGRLNV